jgi:hypothetical protein
MGARTTALLHCGKTTNRAATAYQMSTMAARFAYLTRLVRKNRTNFTACIADPQQASRRALHSALLICAAHQHSTFPSTDRQFYATCHPGAGTAGCRGSYMQHHPARRCVQQPCLSVLSVVARAGGCGGSRALSPADRCQRCPARQGRRALQVGMLGSGSHMHAC